MSFWSDIEPYIQYWLRADISRYDNPDEYFRIEPRRSRRHRSDDLPTVDDARYSPTMSEDRYLAKDELSSTQVHEPYESLQRPSRRSRRNHVSGDLKLPPVSRTDRDGANQPEAPSVGGAPRVARRAALSTAENQQEIEALKLRYIVGRQSGKDIFAQGGHIIVRQGDVIDEQVVAEADAAGKLVELILHMVIEDFEP